MFAAVSEGTICIAMQKGTEAFSYKTSVLT